MNDFFHIVDFLIFQILIFFQIRKSVKKYGVDTGTISIIKGFVFLELFCLYNLILGRSTILVIFEFFKWMFKNGF
ncbi:hypothetical protein [Bergeyella sp. RCAD1439]|uniref:hypothetical protein n=1 Tax=Bergeyella anatis TaxID=3113737 RepID=UPI002E198C8D|nr:hypothetical protein [Bergeyella sp. RCAD1439]